MMHSHSRVKQDHMLCRSFTCALNHYVSLKPRSSASNMAWVVVSICFPYFRFLCIFFGFFFLSNQPLLCPPDDNINRVGSQFLVRVYSRFVFTCGIYITRPPFIYSVVITFMCWHCAFAYTACRAFNLVDCFCYFSQHSFHLHFCD